MSTGDRAIDMLIDAPEAFASSPAAASAPARDRRASVAATKASEAGADAEGSSLRDAMLRDAAALASAEQKRARTLAEEAAANSDLELQLGEPSDRTGIQGAAGPREERADGVLSGLTRVIALLREHRKWLLMVALGVAGLAVGVSVSRATNGHRREARSREAAVAAGPARVATRVRRRQR